MLDLSDFPITQRWPACHPDRLQLYSLATPNGVKVSIMLEETGLPYEVHLVDNMQGENTTPAFRGLNPNAKIPAILDPDGPGGAPLALFESGAILLYLAEKTGQFLPADPARRWETIQWLFFQMAAIGPMFGQVGYFNKFAGRDSAKIFIRFDGKDDLIDQVDLGIWKRLLAADQIPQRVNRRLICKHRHACDKTCVGLGKNLIQAQDLFLKIGQWRAAAERMEPAGRKARADDPPAAGRPIGAPAAKGALNAGMLRRYENIDIRPVHHLFGAVVLLRRVPMDDPEMLDIGGQIGWGDLCLKRDMAGEAHWVELASGFIIFCGFLEYIGHDRSHTSPTEPNHKDYHNDK
jgi:glutathione S-transferase